jgi:hypothetical protein
MPIMQTGSNDGWVAVHKPQSGVLTFKLEPFGGNEVTSATLETMPESAWGESFDRQNAFCICAQTVQP